MEFLIRLFHFDCLFEEAVDAWLVVFETTLFLVLDTSKLSPEWIIEFLFKLFHCSNWSNVIPFLFAILQSESPETTVYTYLELFPDNVELTVGDNFLPENASWSHKDNLLDSISPISEEA